MDHLSAIAVRVCEASTGSSQIAQAEAILAVSSGPRVGRSALGLGYRNGGAVAAVVDVMIGRALVDQRSMAQRVDGEGGACLLHIDRPGADLALSAATGRARNCARITTTPVT